MIHSQVIEDSEKFTEWLDRKIDGLDLPSGRRHRVAGGCLDLTMEYQKGILLLVKERLYGAAFALLRAVFESYVRGIWLHRCATEEDLENLAKDKIPKFYELVKAVEKLEGHEDKVLSKIKERAWKAMNSYTHTGYLQVMRRQTETSIEPNYDDDEVLEVVNAANVFGFLSAIALCDLTNNGVLAKTISDTYESLS